MTQHQRIALARGEASSSQPRVLERTRASLAAVLMSMIVAGSALAATPPPSGGHHPNYFGGNNRAGYPPLNATTAVPKEDAAIGAALGLRASPNPFTARTELNFVARAGEPVSVRIYSPSGRLIRRLAPAASGAPGTRMAIWDGRDSRGRLVGAGLYFARVEAGRRAETLRMVRLR